MNKLWWELNTALFDEAGDGDGTSGGEAEGSEESGAEGEEGSEGDSDEANESQDDDLTDEELVNAKGLFKLLKDPNTRDITLRTMAAKAGVLGKEIPTTPKEEKEAIRDVADVLKDSLGPEYFALFGDKLAKGLKELFAQERGETNKTTASLLAKQTESDVDRSIERLNRETKGEYNKFRPQMEVLADKILPADGTSNYEYLKLLYQVASGEKSRASANKQIADRINRNRSDVADRTHQLSRANSDNKTQLGTGPKGLKNIVEQAIQSVGGGGKK